MQSLAIQEEFAKFVNKVILTETNQQIRTSVEKILARNCSQEFVSNALLQDNVLSKLSESYFPISTQIEVVEENLNGLHENFFSTGRYRPVKAKIGIENSLIFLIK